MLSFFCNMKFQQIQSALFFAKICLAKRFIFFVWITLYIIRGSGKIKLSFFIKILSNVCGLASLLPLVLESSEYSTKYIFRYIGDVFCTAEFRQAKFELFSAKIWLFNASHIAPHIFWLIREQNFSWNW